MNTYWKKLLSMYFACSLVYIIVLWYWFPDHRAITFIFTMAEPVQELAARLKSISIYWSGLLPLFFFFFFLTSKKEESLLYTHFLIEAEVLCCHLLHTNGNSSVSTTWLSPKTFLISFISHWRLIQAASALVAEKPSWYCYSGFSWIDLPFIYKYSFNNWLAFTVYSSRDESGKCIL